ncbi:hypothetical protein PG996_008592 [Apiospora saccharicola]|uniref:Uncharacterized protein n=1 Tax=Apiospora saccharicola TaxID=335842 RepID=A0ABR1UYF3_9PEZI
MATDSVGPAINSRWKPDQNDAKMTKEKESQVAIPPKETRTMEREKGAIRQDEDRSIYKPGRRTSTISGHGQWQDWMSATVDLISREWDQESPGHLHDEVEPDRNAARRTVCSVYVVSQVVAHGVTNGTEKPAFRAWLRMVLMVS